MSSAFSALTSRVSEKAADLLYGVLSPELYLLYVRDRGWTPGQWEEWVYDTLRSQFCVGLTTKQADGVPSQRIGSSRTALTCSGPVSARQASRLMPFSKSQVHAELGRLELLRMVDSTEVPQDRLLRFARFGEFLEQAPGTHYARITVLFGRKFAEAVGEWAEEAQALFARGAGPDRPATAGAAACIEVAAGRPRQRDGQAVSVPAELSPPALASGTRR